MADYSLPEARKAFCEFFTVFHLVHRDNCASRAFPDGKPSAYPPYPCTGLVHLPVSSRTVERAFPES